MTLQQQPPEAGADVRVKVFVDRPATVTKVQEPSGKDAIEVPGYRLDRTAPRARCQLGDPRLDLRKDFATRIDFVPAERVAQKREALLAAVNDLRLRGMQSQTGRLDSSREHRQRCFGFRFAATIERRSRQRNAPSRITRRPSDGQVG